MSGNQSTGTDTLVKTVLIFFISLLSFSIGTFVGKKFSDNQHKLVALEPGSHKENESHDAELEKESSAESSDHEAVAESDSSETDEHISEAGTKHETVAEGEGDGHEEADKTAEGEGAEATKEGHGSVAATSHATIEKGAAHHEEPPSETHVEKRKLAQQEPKKIESEKEPIKIPSAVAKEVAKNGSGNFTIQVASYASPEEAEKKVSELKSLKFESFTTAATIKGSLWYRVNVGMFATIKEAQEHKSLLSEKAKINAAIIQKLRK